ncbi:hypothetical protein ZWY2020_021368 [Hordeum vulgare]|nr:hypothetical protein ZWY2020_021368 [Hordeum vulgare]
MEERNRASPRVNGVMRRSKKLRPVGGNYAPRHAIVKFVWFRVKLVARVSGVGTVATSKWVQWNSGSRFHFDMIV